MPRRKQIPRLAAVCILLTLLATFGPPAALAGRGSAASGTADALAEARATLQEAFAREKAHPDKAAALAVEAALDAYNALAAQRVAELQRALERLDRQFARTLPPADGQENPAADRAPQAPRMPEAMAARYAELRAELLALSKPLVASDADFVRETEPNDTPAQATPLDVAVQAAAIGSGLITMGDVDYYSFQVPANSLVWAYVDTGGTPLGTSNDSVVTVFGPDGATALESDDDDGTGNACDATTESLAASAVAGLFAPTPGTYYARVAAASSGATINPYVLFVSVTPAASVVPEAESNDTPQTADPVLSPSSPVGVVSGALSTPGDVDLFSLPIAAGTPLYVSLDADPERDGGADLAVDLLTRDGVTVLFTADSSPAAVANAEAFCFVFPTTDTYLVRVRRSGAVRQVGGAPATYRLLAAEAELGGRCPPAIIHGTLGSGSADYPGQSGLQIGRLTRNGLPSSCGFAKPFPGLFDPAGLRAYDAYTFTNRDAQTVCMNVRYSTMGAPPPGIFAVVYLGAFDPNDVSRNYLADSGLSIFGTFMIQFGFDLRPGQSAVVVLSDVNPGTAAGTPYTLEVTGLTCPLQTPFDVCMRDDATGAVFQTLVGNRASPDYGRWVYTSGGTTLCGRADQISYVAGRSLLMRDYNQANNSGCAPAVMFAQFDFARHTAVVQITPLGGRTITLRDRDLSDSACGP